MEIKEGWVREFERWEGERGWERSDEEKEET
jgi:hypothetical protein